VEILETLILHTILTAVCGPDILTKQRRTKLTFRGFFNDDAKSDNDSDVIICSVHGGYPASMKAFGCPECVKEAEDEEQEEEMLNKSKIARFNTPRKR
jgi:hypothetical protein